MLLIYHDLLCACKIIVIACTLIYEWLHKIFSVTILLDCNAKLLHRPTAVVFSVSIVNHCFSLNSRCKPEHSSALPPRKLRKHFVLHIILAVDFAVNQLFWRHILSH